MKNFVQYSRGSKARVASTLSSVFAILITAAALMLSTQSIAATVIEFYNINLDHYFITSDANEAAAIDNGSAGPGWSRTGNTFYSGGTTTVCRFYGSQSPGPNSHFYTADPTECLWLQQLQAATPATEKRWNFESLDFVSTPSVNQTCQSGTVPIYRAYNNGFARGVDSNHRITGNVDAIDDVLARGWIDEGVVMCAPASACVAPAMQNSVGACMLPPAPTGYTWNNIIKAWVADIGVLVTGVNTLPATCVTIGDACWLDSVADGTIKLTNTNAVATGVNTRPIVFASYVVGNSSFFGYYVSVPLYADVATQSATLNQNIENGGVNAPIADVKGSASGLKQNFLSAGCWERVWGGNGAWGNISISCPI